MSDEVARNRYYMMMAVQLAATAGAVFGLVILAKNDGIEMRVLGGAILLSGLYVSAVVPRALARKWRTPPSN